MQAGRELDVKVAEALGWGVEEMEGNGYTVPDFSTTWEGMGVLVEEAKKQGIAFRVETRFIDGSFFDYQCLASNGQTFGMATSGTAPYAACLALLKVKGVAV
ncbi:MULTISPECIES: hypothetical protein [Brevibacillus]|uniref:hypothetical protein n=1 Tax=Brevibacillus TaxID=55080 RepID=UPI00287FD007|nr:hypothetical protein [Brevibacillus borstelensis]WNF07248.1 hypothetical protein RFB14_07420 [Brevibacillus borstelensis]